MEVPILHYSSLLPCWRSGHQRVNKLSLANITMLASSFRGEDPRCCSIYTTTINETKPKSYTCWEKLLNIGQIALSWVFSLFSVCKASSPKKSSAHLTLPSCSPCPMEGRGLWLRGVAAIFHSHLQFCLDVTQAKPAKPKKKNGYETKKTVPKRFSLLVCFQVLTNYLPILKCFIITTVFLLRFLQYVIFYLMWFMFSFNLWINLSEQILLPNLPLNPLTLDDD